VSEVRVSGRRLPLSPLVVRRVIESVLRAERRDAWISVTFLGRDAMRRLNAAHMGHDYPTDVLSFRLKTPTDQIVGDVYVCPWVARREAASRGISVREELVRLLVHGTLHVLGRDHPEGPARTRSAMWRRQERYVEALT
jgi:probable rRNA maturation factor